MPRSRELMILKIYEKIKKNEIMMNNIIFFNLRKFSYLGMFFIQDLAHDRPVMGRFGKIMGYSAL